MSVLVKGMSIPDNCESCAFETGFGFCLAKSDNFCGYTNYRKRPEWCPLVEVPEPHGDLIDRDALVKEMTNGIRAGNLEEGYEEYQNINNMDDCVDCVSCADAVIEAEGE